MLACTISVDRPSTSDAPETPLLPLGARMGLRESASAVAMGGVKAVPAHRRSFKDHREQHRSDRCDEAWSRVDEADAIGLVTGLDRPLQTNGQDQQEARYPRGQRDTDEEQTGHGDDPAAQGLPGPPRPDHEDRQSKRAESQAEHDARGLQAPAEIEGDEVVRHVGSLVRGRPHPEAQRPLR